MADIQDKNDVKIFILYILRHVGYPIDYATVIDLVLGGGVVRYFDFIECFADLVEAGSVLRCDPNAEGEYKATEEFVISQQGIDISDALSSEIATYMRDKSLKRALQYLSFKRDGTCIGFDVEPMYDRRSRVIFTLSRESEVFFRIELISDNEKLTERIRGTVGSSPEDVYKGVLSLLAGDSDYIFNE